MIHKKTQVVLINPRFEVSHQPPLGLAYIASALLASGHRDVSIIDTAFNSLDRDLSMVREPMAFGLTVMHPYLAKSIDTVRRLRTGFPGIPIIAGGPFPSVVPDEALTRLGADFCVRGEGEETLREWVDYLKGNRGIESIPGLSYRNPETGVISHNPDRSHEKNLDRLPFPARSLLPMDRYIAGGTQKAFSYRNIRSTTMIASRGCAYRCTYCQPTLSHIFGNRVRHRSVENIVEEIELLVRDFGVQGIFFVDDTFTLKRDFTVSFCETILKRGIRCDFALNARITTVDQALLALLKRAGVVTIMYGVESGDQGVLNQINKRITVERIRGAILQTRRAGINAYGYFMIGSPEDSAASLSKTFSLVRSLPFTEVQFSIATPYPGTEMYEQAVKEDLMINGRVMEEKGYYGSSAMHSRHLSARAIRRWFRLFRRYQMFRSFLSLLRHPFAIPSVVLNKIMPRFLKNRSR